MNQTTTEPTADAASYQTPADLYRILFEQAADGIFIANPQGRYIEVNRRGCEMVGYSRAELLHMSMADLVAPEELTRHPIRMEELRAGKSVTSERQLHCKDGRLLPVEITGQMLSDGNLLGIVRDITERQQAQKALERERARLKTLVQTIPDLVWLKDMSGVFLACNSTFERLYNTTEAEIVGKTDYDFVNAELADFFRANDQAAIAAGGPRLNDEWVTFADSGRRILLETIKTPMVDATGQVIGVLGISRDVTAARQSAVMLRERVVLQQRLEQLAAVAPGGLYSMVRRPNGALQMLYVSAAWEEIHGLTAADLTEDLTALMAMVHPDDAAYFRQEMNKAAQTLTQVRLELRLRTAHRGEIWVENRVTPVLEPDGSILWHGFVIDITERKRAVEYVRLKDELLRMTGDMAQIGGWEFDVATLKGIWTDGVTSIHDLPADEETNVELGLSFYTEESRPIIAAAVKAAVEQAQPYDLEVEIISAAGRRKWIRTMGQPIIEGGKVVKVRGTLQDITERKQTEARLRESEERLQLTLEATQIGVWDWDIKNDRWYASSIYYTMLGYEPVSGPSDRSLWLERVHPDDRPHVQAKIQSVLAKNFNEYNYEARMRHANGSYRWHQVLGFATERDQTGSVTRMLGIRMDITERKQAEESLRLGMAHLRLALEAAKAGVWEWDLRTNENIWSEELWPLYGLTPHSCQPSYAAWRQVVHPDDRARVEAITQQCARLGVEISTEWRVRDSDGTERWLMSRGHPWRNAAGQVVRYIGIALDITERKQVEETLRASEQGIRNLFENVPVGMFQSTPEGKFIYVNRAIAQMLGYSSPAEVIELVNQTSIAQALYEDPTLRPRLVAEVEQAEGNWRIFEARYRRKDGQIIDAILSFSVRPDPITGQPNLYSFVQNITERKQAEDALRVSEQNYREIFNATSEAIFIDDAATGQILDVNESMLNMYGFASKAEVLAGNIGNLSAGTPPYTEDEAQRRIRLTLAGQPQTFDWLAMKKSGEYFWAEVSLRSAQIGGQARVLAVVRDITERKQAEDALRESNAKLELLFNLLPVGLSVLDGNRNVVKKNAALDTILSIPKGGDYSFRQYLRLDGTPMSPAEFPSSRVAHGEPAVFNTEIGVVKDDGAVAWVNVSAVASPFADWTMVIVTSDITERKQAEDKLRATLEEKETLLREVHHRVKNNLQVIIALLNMQSAQIQDAKTRQFLKEMEGQARTMALVYEQLYQSENLARVAMAPYLQRLTSSVLEVFGRQRRVQLTLEATVSLDVAQAMPCGLIVNELFTNILKYAFPPTFSEQPQVYIAMHQIEQTCRLVVSDNGVGLPPGYDEKSGQTLGLRFVNLWATHQLGGQLKVTGNPGTCFTITFNL